MERNTNKIAYNLGLENQALVQKNPTQESGVKSLNTRSDGGEGSGRLEEGILALSPPSRVYCENAFGTRLMLMVQGGKSHDRG
jgi:hypothetical protein